MISQNILSIFHIYMVTSLCSVTDNSLSVLKVRKKEKDSCFLINLNFQGLKMAAVQYLSWIYLSPILFVPNPLCPIMRFAIQLLFPQSPTPWGNERRYVYTFLSLIVDLKDPLFWVGCWPKWRPILFNEISRSFYQRGSENVAIWTFRLMRYFKNRFLL